MSRDSYIVGRSAPATLIATGPGQDSLSRQHASITPSPKGAGYFNVSDLDSTNGTFVNHNGVWTPIQSAEVHECELIRFGSFCTTLEELLNKTRTVVVEDKTQPITQGTWERDPYTGIVRFRPYGS